MFFLCSIQEAKTAPSWSRSLRMKTKYGWKPSPAPDRIEYTLRRVIPARPASCRHSGGTTNIWYQPWSSNLLQGTASKMNSENGQALLGLVVSRHVNISIDLYKYAQANHINLSYRRVRHGWMSMNKYNTRHTRGTGRRDLFATRGPLVSKSLLFVPLLDEPWILDRSDPWLMEYQH